MLEYQKVKLLEKHARNVLKLEPFLLKISGYNPEDTRLKIDKHLLHCSPATFTLTSCKLLLFLSKNESEHFKQYEKKLVSLNLAFDNTYFGTPVSFFIKGKMENLEELRENVFSLEFALNSVPEDYKQLFLYLSEISFIYRKIYDTKLNAVQQTGLKRLPIYKTQVFKDGVLVCHAKVNNLSTRHIELDLNNDSIVMEMDNIYKYTILYNGRGINLSGKIVKNKGNLYISSLDFNLEYIHILSKYMQMSQTNEPTGSEELEEL